MKNPALKLRILLGALVTVLLWMNAISMAQTVTGSLVGIIVDQQGAVVPNAAVSAKDLETGAERNAMSDATGHYNIVSVPAGAYQVTASASGFKIEIRSGITMTVGAVVRVDFTLTVGTVAEKVEVMGEAPQVDTTTSTIAGLVSDIVIRELPLNGRDWLSLAELQPGVIAVQVGATPFLRTGLGQKLSISGGRISGNVYRVDGLVVNDQSNNSPGGAMGVNLGVDGMREFSVLTNTYSTEYGRSSGGVINAITKSGTNAFHGTAFEFIRNSDMDARNFFDTASAPLPSPNPPFRRNQFGGALGGPIKKDKLFFFGNYEGLRQFLSESLNAQTLSPNARNGILCANAACTSTMQVPIDPRIMPYLPLYPVANGRITGDTGQFVMGAGQVGSEDYAIGRIDYQVGASTTLFGSYTFDNSNIATPDTFDEKLVGTLVRNQRLMLSLQRVFSATLLNTVRGGLSRTAGADSQDTSPNIPLLSTRSLAFVPGQYVGIIAVTGLGSFGGLGSDGANQYWYTAPQLNDDLVWVKGRNNIRIGFSLEEIRDNVNGLSVPTGEWAFGSIQNLLTVTSPQLFESDLPGTDTYRGMRTKIFGAYFQDDFRIRPNLTLNLGVRYEPSTVISVINGKAANLQNLAAAQPNFGNPMYSNPTLRNFAPRVGLAWDPFGDGRTAIRSGFGVFDVVPVMNLLSQKVIRTAPFYQEAIVTNPPASSFPSGGLNLVSPTSVTSTNIEPSPHPAYKLQWNLNIEHQIARGLSIMAGYVGSRGNHLPLTVQDTDQVPPSLVTVAPDGHLLFPTTGTIQKINPNYSDIRAIHWDGFSIYHSLQFNVIQQLRRGVTVQGVYVWSKSIDNGTNEYSAGESGGMGPTYAFDQNLDRGPSEFDITQHMSANFVWQVPSLHSGMVVPRFLLSGWELGGIYTVQSGTPFSVRITVDRARTGNSQITSSGSGQRPDFNAAAPGCSVDAVNPGFPSSYINLSCFSFPALGELGNLGRNTLRGPGLENFNFSLVKNHNLLAENLKVQFRAEFFNLFNRTNFGTAIATVFNSSGLPVQANSALTSTATTSRQIQFGLKLIW